jgi:hypothetical protein
MRNNAREIQPVLAAVRVVGPNPECRPPARTVETLDGVFTVIGMKWLGLRTGKGWRVQPVQFDRRKQWICVREHRFVPALNTILGKPGFVHSLGRLGDISRKRRAHEKIRS